MLVECFLCPLDSGVEIVVIKGWVEDFVAVVFQISRFDATGDGLTAVKEEDFHFTF